MSFGSTLANSSLPLLFFSLFLSLTVHCLTAATASESASESAKEEWNPYETTIDEIHKSLSLSSSNKKISCVEVAKSSYLRISAYEKNKELDGGLNSMVLVTEKEDLIKRAQELDKKYNSFDGDDFFESFPLHCIPVIIKDNYNLAGLPTSGGVLDLGSKNSNNSIAVETCPVVKNLLKAGALIMGKSNMPDFAINGMNTNSSVLGQTSNPYFSGFTPYGSSGGSAVSVAASYAVFSLGTDTNGSIQNPSSAASLVGLRPTQGLVSTVGVLPLSTLQDTSGPMARNTMDLAIALGVMVSQAPSQYSRYSSLLSQDSLNGSRLGFLRTIVLPHAGDPVVAIPGEFFLLDCWCQLFKLILICSFPLLPAF